MTDMAEIGKKTGQTCDVAGIALPLHSESLERQESPQIDELRHFLESLQPGDKVWAHAPAGDFLATVKVMDVDKIILATACLYQPWTFHVWRDTGGNENSNIFIKPLDAGHGWLAPWTLFETSWEAA